ncbi:MAG: flagellar filament capping protein FliD [Candidatus Cloacimonetes bacterium]|nr:flagellar filament capping protein FliD [Candidatus Cloacimonadota bacterium]MDD2650409.1 flagellar filament capping protein FliD [Candidatus Cloacimonadota bacterium]
MSGDIKITGLATGIDFDEMTQKLVEAEQYQAKKLDSWKLTWINKIDALTQLNFKISSIKTTNNVLKDMKSFINRLASSSDSSVADIAVDSTAPLGSYKLEVAESVKHKVGSRGVNDKNDIVATDNGSLRFKDGEGKTISVSLYAGMTFEELHDEIESALSAQNSNAKVSISNDKSSTEPLRLVITSAKAGTSGMILFEQDDTNLKFMETSYDNEFEAITGTSFSIIEPEGTYLGNINKRLEFKILDSGTVGDKDIRIQWTDLTSNHSEIVTITDVGEFAITQGFKLNISAGELEKNDVFAIDLHHPDIQKAQNTGLAQTARVSHEGLSSAKAIVTATAGKFAYTYSGNEIKDLQVPANTTLEGLIKIINEDARNPGVIASIVNDGLGTSQSYHLVLTGKNSGADNQISISSSTLDNISSSDFETTRTASNAMFKIDDYPAENDSWIQNSSNLITDVIPNGSVTLKKSGITTFTINNDNSAMADKVQEFIDSYNDALDYINEMTKVVLNENDEAVTEKGGILVGNYAVNIVKDKLKTFIGERAIGFDGNEDLSLFTQIGIKTGDKNKIEFDRDAFIKELSTNPDAVINLFSADNIGSTDNSTFHYTSHLSTTKAGVYEIEAEFDNGEIKSVKYRKQGSNQWFTSDDNKDIKISEDKSYFTIFGGDARGVMVSAIDGGTGIQKTTMSIREGKAKTFDREMDILLDEDTGTTKVLTKNYEGIIKNIDKRIERENMRLVQIRSRLTNRFARLEANMQQLQGQMNRLQSQIESMSN